VDYHAEVVKDVGIFGLKTLVALNSGAAVVLLAFLSNIYGHSDPNMTLHLAPLRWATVFFVVGIAGAMVSLTMTYILAQLGGMGHAKIGEMHPAHFLALMIVPAVASFLFFGGGCACAMIAFG
jgi:hypothetical protein